MTDAARLVPLHRFPVFHTRDPDVMAGTVADVWGGRDFTFRDGPQPFEVTVNFLQLKQIGLAASEFSGSAGFRVPTQDLIRQPFTLSGAAVVDFDGRHFAVNRNETCVVPSDAAPAITYRERFSHLALLIAAPVLGAKLSALLGSPIVGAIDFATTAKFDVPEMARLRRLLEFFVDEVDRAEFNMADHALAEFEDLLIVSFLTANRHNYSQLLERESPGPAPWQVRLVEDYIEAHWNEPLSIDALARVTQGSVRSIFKAFKMARGVTPMAYVKSVRLRHARRMLETPDPTTSVIGVSLHCGFFNPGHFARHYRAAFGELPSATLARSRHRRKVQD